MPPALPMLPGLRSRGTHDYRRDGATGQDQAVRRPGPPVPARCTRGEPTYRVRLPALGFARSHESQAPGTRHEFAMRRLRHRLSAVRGRASKGSVMYQA